MNGKDCLYLVSGKEDSFESMLCREADLVETVAEIIWGDAKEMPAEEREQWKRALADEDSWCVDSQGRNFHFHREIGECAWVEITLVTYIGNVALA